MTKKIAGEVVEKEFKAREGYIYMTSKHVYKIFGKNTNPYDVLFNVKKAEAAGVTVPSTSKFTAELKGGEGEMWLSGICMDRISGEFFQLSKDGGEARLCKSITAIASQKIITNVITCLENAEQLGVTDPQGFINPRSDPAIYFIDVHFTEKPNYVTFERILTTARTHKFTLNE